jgi:DNA-directed RNA polymerase subunit beta
MVSFKDDKVVYKLSKFLKTNQSTCINLKPIVKKRSESSSRSIYLSDGFALLKIGELALGSNLKVAFMPWKGYNFEDAIVISERIVRDDVFTSIQIEDYSN